MSLNTAFIALATAALGRQVLEGTDNATSWRVTKLSDKIGSLKDGTKGAYVVLTSDDDKAFVMMLHPNRAQSLFKKGSDKDLTLVDEAKVVEDLIAGTTEAELQAELAAEQASETVPEVAVEEKKVSKKELFVEMYILMTSQGATRKEIRARVQSELAMSDACFNTYAQNCRSQKAGWV